MINGLGVQAEIPGGLQRLNPSLTEMRADLSGFVNKACAMLLTCEELTLRSLATGLFRKSALCEDVLANCSNEDGPRDYHTTGRKSDREKYVISLAYRSYKHELIYKAEANSQTTNMVTKGEGRGY